MRNQTWSSPANTSIARLAALALALLAATPVGAAITVDSVASTAGNTAPPSTTVSWEHTVGTGEDRILVVGISSLAHGPTRVSFGDRELARTHSAASGGAEVSEIWILLAPPPGPATVIATFEENPFLMVGGSVSLYGVDQGAPIHSVADATGVFNAPVAVPITTTVTTGVGDLVIANLAAQAGVGPEAGQTALWSWGGLALAGASAAREATGAATTVGWRVSGSSSPDSFYASLVAISLAPAPSAAAGIPLLDLRGLVALVVVLALVAARQLRSS